MRAALFAALTLPLALAGCKTMDAMTAEITGRSTYQAVPGRFIEVADKRRVASADQDQVTRLGETLAGRGPAVTRGLDGSVELPRGLEELPGAEPLQRYAEGVLARLLRGWPHAAPRIRVVVSTDSGYGAQAYSGDIVELHQGTLVNCTSEDELAFILAHEAAHILLNHLDADRHHEAEAALEDGAAGIALAALAKAADGKAQASQGVALAYGAYRELQKKVLKPSWDRQQEDEADLLGHDLLLLAGYNNSVYQTVMERMQDFEKKQEEEEREKQQQLDRQVTELMESGQFDAGMNAAFARLKEGPMLVLERLVGLVGKGHNSAQRRLDDLDSYVMREELYESAGRPLNEKPYQAAVYQGAGLRVLTRGVLAQRAETLIGRGEHAEAEALLKEAMKGGFEGDPELRYQRAQLHAAQGRTDLAMKDLEVALRSPAAKEKVYAKLQQQLALAGKLTQALAVLDQADRRFGGAEGRYPQRIALLAAAGQHRDAGAVYDRCRALKGNPVVRHCDLAAREALARQQAPSAPPVVGS
ncbi:M48 family metalloprotease [Arenibaculum pallidiluteum]|uniref:M48 family metalloprotease n=1 Tax=Arenibaculum pallidiluteum TaxID=2812559 RepID=UPI001A96CE9C|nr:M48 family metalloprotease [Arenibaculum pallidiluteum]